MSNNGLLFSDLPNKNDTAFPYYFQYPWDQGTTKKEFLLLANSMTKEDYKKFSLSYIECHFRSKMNWLNIMFSKHNFWSSSKYCLLNKSIYSAPNTRTYDKSSEDNFKEKKKTALKEGLITTTNSNIVVKSLIKKYNFNELYSPKWLHNIMYSGCACASTIVDFFPLSPKQIGVVTGPDLNVSTIYVKIPDIDKNKDLLKKAMSFFGYTLSLEEDDESTNCPADASWKILTFVPDFQEYVTERILEENNYLFHISPARFKDKILKQGLCPTSKNNKFDYKPRIYLMLQLRYSIPNGKNYEFTEELGKHLAYILHDAKPEKEKQWKNYIIYKIETAKLDKNKIHISYDQEYYPLGIFTSDNIFPKAIEIFSEFSLD